MYSVINNLITLVRGDTATFNVDLKTEEDGSLEDYTPAAGDRIVFKVKKNYNDANAIITKTGTTISLSHNDTKDLSPGEYVYDVTFISSDNTVIDHVIPVTKFIIKEAL